MRRLLPDPVDDVDLRSVYADVSRPAPPGRPWVVANMVASADGAATVSGRSGGLSGAGDKDVFRTLRAAADVVVAAAGTVRAERYRPIREPRPTPIAVVSRSLDLEWEAPLFADAPARTIVLTCEGADPGARRHAATLADVVVAGGDVVDLGLAMAALAQRGHHVALCEGGPRLLAQVAAAGALDELCLTVSPLLAAGQAPRILDGGDLPAPSRLALASVLEDDGFLLLRYLVAAGVPDDDGT